MKEQPCIVGWATKVMTCGAEHVLVADNLDDLEVLFLRVIVGGVFKKEGCHTVAVVSLSRLDEEVGE